MKILYVGHSKPGSTSRHRAEALRRLGLSVTHLDPFLDLAPYLRGFRAALHYRTGYRLLQSRVGRWCTSHAPIAAGADVVWMDSGELFGRRAVQALLQHGQASVLFNNDDPTGPRDGQRFASLRKALATYALVAVHDRDVPDEEFQAFGVQRRFRVKMSYDEVQHAPFKERGEISHAFRSKIAFIGTWIPGERRDEFVAHLLGSGLPVAIWGSGWHKAPSWPAIRHAWRGPSLADRDYVAAIQGADISLGLLSKGNRDGHTRRSVEIPFAAGLLCAERTPEHTAMYREGEEAAFWADAEECVAVCRRLLGEEALRERIRHAGRQRVLSMKVGNEDVCTAILRELETHAPRTRSAVVAPVSA